MFAKLGVPLFGVRKTRGWDLTQRADREAKPTKLLNKPLFFFIMGKPKWPPSHHCSFQGLCVPFMFLRICPKLESYIPVQTQTRA